MTVPMDGAANAAASFNDTGASVNHRATCSVAVWMAVLLGSRIMLADDTTNGMDRVVIDLKSIVASNIPGIEKSIGRDGLRLRITEAGPADGGFFFLRYRFEIPTAGPYCLAIQGRAPGSREYSRYSYVVDGEAEHEALCRRRVTPDNGTGLGWNEQLPMELAAGPHQIEFRFDPDQRVRKMNRVREPYDGHRVEMKAVAFRRNPEAKAAPVEDRQRLRPGQTIVLFGDSITDEGLYAAHLARLLEVWQPGANIACYNAGISLNRTWEAMERLDRDVIALRPDWVVLAFGVNDSVHMAPDEFARNCEELILRLKAAKIGVICATPSGMLPALVPGEKTYFHAPDRAAGFDRTMEYQAGLVVRLARKHQVPCVDLLAMFQGAGKDRAALMGSQWHPGREGGRWIALALLRAWGMTETDVASSADPKDAESLHAILGMPQRTWPVYEPQFHTNEASTAAKLIAWSSFSRNEVVVMTDAGQEVARVPVGHHPMGLVFAPKRSRLYVACEATGSVEVLSVPGFKREKPIELGDVYPVSIALNNREDTAWVGNFFGSSVSEVDLETGQVRRQIPVGALVESLLWLPEHGRLLVATRQGLKLVDVASGAVEKTLLITDHCDALYRDGEGRVHAIDTVQWKMTRLSLPALEAKEAQPCPVATRTLTRDSGGNLWAGDVANGRIVRRTAGADVFETVTPAEFPLGLAILEPETRAR